MRNLLQRVVEVAFLNTSGMSRVFSVERPGDISIIYTNLTEVDAHFKLQVSSVSLAEDLKCDIAIESVGGSPNAVEFTTTQNGFLNSLVDVPDSTFTIKGRGMAKFQFRCFDQYFVVRPVTPSIARVRMDISSSSPLAPVWKGV